MPKFADSSSDRVAPSQAQESLLADALGTTGAQFARSAAMFLPGKVGLAGSIVLGGLDNAHRGGPLIADFATGALKGGADFGLTSQLKSRSSWFVLNGAMLGFGTRLADQALDYKTYLNSAGKFDLDHGLNATLRSSFSAASIGGDVASGALGMLGMRGLKDLGLNHLRQSELASTVITGTVFGLSSGGTTELIKEQAAGQFDLQRITEHSFKGALLGAAASSIGGLRSALAPGRNYDQTMPLDRQYLPRLGVPEKSTREFLEHDPQFVIGKDTKRGHFVSHGLRTNLENVIVYRPQGHSAPLVVQGDYAVRLDQVRALREQASLPVRGLADSVGILSARLKLDLHADRQAVLPEAMVRHMDNVPDRSLLGDIHLQSRMGIAAYFDLKKTGRISSVMAEVEPDTYKMWHYKPQLGQNSAENMQHEWAHLLKNKDSKASGAFDQAAQIEQGGWVKRGYAETNSEENWAVHMGELILAPAASKPAFEFLVLMAPTRSAVMGTALAERLAATRPEDRSPNHELWLERVAHIKENAEPRALKNLEKVLQSNDKDAVERARGVIDYLQS